MIPKKEKKKKTSRREGQTSSAVTKMDIVLAGRLGMFKESPNTRKEGTETLRGFPQSLPKTGQAGPRTNKDGKRMYLQRRESDLEEPSGGTFDHTGLVRGGKRASIRTTVLERRGTMGRGGGKIW